MKKQKLKQLFLASLAGVGIFASAQGATITVNTVNNADFSAGVTNLWLAIQMANTNGESANTINFNISGAGPHYIITPQFSAPGGVPDLNGGYPIITNHNLTIDGYSQPGALANTNTILGSNTAALKIVIDSRAVNYTADANHPLLVGANTMNYALITGKTYGNVTDGYVIYDATDAAQIGIFNATNVSVKGLCFLNDHYPGADSLDVYSVALGVDFPTNLCALANTDPARPHYYPDYSLHVSGCWFNLQPDGVTAVDGGTTAVSSKRHKGGSNSAWLGNARWSPSDGTFGVAKNSANPRAEFNIVMSQGAGVTMDGERNRYCGNFFNVFASGMTQYFPDPQRTTADGVNTAFVPTVAFISSSDSGYGTIGADGDGINDAEERNVFAGLTHKRDGNEAIINYQSGCYNLKFAGNYLGMAVDGVTHFTNMSTIFRVGNRPDNPTNMVVGSDFDGVSDAIEGNVIGNNWPLDYWFPNRASTEPDLSLYSDLYLFPYTQDGAPCEVFSNDKQIGQYGLSFRGNKCLNTLSGPLSPFNVWEDASPDENGNFGTYDDCVTSVGVVNKDVYEAATNYVTVLNASSTRRLRGTFPMGINSWTNVIIDVYVANQEGLTSGAEFVTLTNVVPVWAQGESTLAHSLQADTLADLDPATGQFTFNISPYQIPAGTKVTATASYAVAGEVGTYMADMLTSRFSLPVTLTASPNIVITSIVNNGNGTGTINWTGGEAPYIVEMSTNLTSGIWVPVATTPTPTITGPIGLAAAFFRVQ